MFNRLDDAFGPAVRRFLARRPWIRWIAVIALAAGAAWITHAQLAQRDAERDAWGETRTVIVATASIAPGDKVVAESRQLPVAAVPDDAIDEVPDDARTTQRVSPGEVLTATDLAIGPGPTALAEQDQSVVAVRDPLLTEAIGTVEVGHYVDVLTEGIVVASEARITHIDAQVIFVAVERDEAPHVAAAAHAGLASLAFVQP